MVIVGSIDLGWVLLLFVGTGVFWLMRVRTNFRQIRTGNRRSSQNSLMFGFFFGTRHVLQQLVGRDV